MFCRVRPLLPDDGGRQEASVIAYPTSSESLGRGIDVVQSGIFTDSVNLLCSIRINMPVLYINLFLMPCALFDFSGNKHPFTFDKVFDHGASQEEVFFEISQLVQSALDGYKVCYLPLTIL